MNIVIMAGGGGTRLWPVSREKMPKQFAPLVGKKTLLQLTFARALAVTKSPRNIVVTTRGPYAPLVRKQLPKLPRTHILVEPVKRDTAPSVGLAAAFFSARNQGNEPLVMVPSDHLIQNESLFRTALRGLGTLLREHEDRTVLLGAEPTYPETGLGYIERGTRVGTVLGVPAHAVRRFAEKPKLPIAKRYVHSGRFLWNMGVYGWRVHTLLDLFRKHQPDISRRLQELEIVFRNNASPGAIEQIFTGMPSISVDFAITEKQDVRQILVLPGAYGWSDVGQWASLAEVLGGGHGVEQKRGTVVQVKTSGNFVYHDVPVALGLVGVHNLVVVATPDAILICDKNNTQDVKALVAELDRLGHKKFL